MRAFLLLLLVPLIAAQQNCTEYCTNITEVCTGTNQQFNSSAWCEASCWGYLYLSNGSATAGDSWNCRIYHLGVANTSAANAVIHCPHAGFDGGDGTCGTACEAYCDSVLWACTGESTVFTPSSTMSARSACLQQCAFYPRVGGNPPNNATEPLADSWECRSWHVLYGIILNQTTPSTNPLSVHCPHASPTGGYACGTACENYCDAEWSTCTGNLTQWASRTQCLAACATWPVGMVNDTSGDTYGCRKYHVSVANTTAANAQIHCVHTGPLGGYGVCGSACDGYCNLLNTACGVTDMTQCVNNCTGFPFNNTLSTQTLMSWKVPENSLECRTAYAVAALSDSTKCAGAMNGGSLCSISTGGASSIQIAWGLVALLAMATLSAL